MDDRMPQINVTQQIEGFLEQAVADGRLDEELAFRVDFLQGLSRLYQRDEPSSLTTNPSNPPELLEFPQAIRTSTDHTGRCPKRKSEKVAISSVELQLPSAPLRTHLTQDVPRHMSEVHARGQLDGPATKRAKRQPFTTRAFTTRAAECQEQGDSHHGLLAQASQWVSVVSQVCEELAGKATGQAVQASNPCESVRATMEHQVLYFCQVFGKPGQERVRYILRTIRDHQSEGRLISNNSETQYGLEHSSRPLREWIKSIQQQDKWRTPALGGAVQRYIAGAQQYEKWMALLQAAKDSTSETYTKMHALGLTTSQGRDVRTNIKAYFLHITQGFDIREAAAKEEDIKMYPELMKARNSVQNTIATGRTYHVLQNVFGRGIFLLLPDQNLGFFRNNWSKASLEIIATAVATTIPETTLYCKRLRDLILSPVLDGRMVPLLKVELARARSDQGLLELLEPQGEATVSAEKPDPAVTASAIGTAPSSGEEDLGTAGHNCVGVIETDCTPGESNAM